MGTNGDKGMVEGRETRETMEQGMEWSDMGEHNTNIKRNKKWEENSKMSTEREREENMSWQLTMHL